VLQTAAAAAGALGEDEGQLDAEESLATTAFMGMPMPPTELGKQAVFAANNANQCIDCCIARPASAIQGRYTRDGVMLLLLICAPGARSRTDGRDKPAQSALTVHNIDASSCRHV